ncbi:glycoside hydrolase [Desarmillaria tabescens]|uniref:Glycoside hydrolase n=1 Tax=Armillaria tabescens TaxID=1929756 RepID=A0AA39TQ59_ARMTA|nr:glycoside hydrolase [Desarmillaria tabescens]KAK0462613.1 glycoside hydrolase [Desarmillaria tabescens]
MTYALTTLILTPLAICFSRPRTEAMSPSKAGLAWGGNSHEIAQFTSTGKVFWYYTWSPKSYIPGTNIEFVPMLWGSKETEEFSSTINDTLAGGGVTAVLGMNESQETQQSNLTCSEGADMWKTYIEPLRSHSEGVKLGSSAPSGAPSGKIWLEQFLTVFCDTLSVLQANCFVTDWFDINSTQFVSHLQNFHGTFDRPIWVTEWVCQNFNDADNNQCSEEEIKVFLNATQSFMDNTDWVERYTWFGAMTDLQGVNQGNALMNSDRDINSLGKQYTGEEDNMHLITSGGVCPFRIPNTSACLTQNFSVIY